MANLNFNGKAFVLDYHKTLPSYRLEIDNNKSYVSGIDLFSSEIDRNNKIIHADNLYALNALLPEYKGKIKCIYIDPPYNTGKEDWLYNDNVNNELINSWFKEQNIDKSILDNHDKWLCMMWPRLKLIHELLAEDGFLFISIDDYEVHNLKKIVDEIFGNEEKFPKGNFIGSIIWVGTQRNNSRLLHTAHDYILCYCKNYKHVSKQKIRWQVKKQGLSDIYEQFAALKFKYESNYKKIEEEMSYWYKTLAENNPAKQWVDYSKIDAKGIYRHDSLDSPSQGKGGRYNIIHPITKKPCKMTKNGWRYTEEKMIYYLEQDKISFGNDETIVPRFKRYLVETEHQSLSNIYYKRGQEATYLLNDILNLSFPFPKDHKILKTIFEAVTEKNDIILDCFAGSGTTAHAILELNREDNGKRNFILIESEEYANSITAERIRKIMKGIKNNKDKALSEGLGGSFAFYTLKKD